MAGQEGAEANGKGLCPFLFLLSPVPCKALSCCSPITQAGIARRGGFRATDSGAVAFGSEATSSGFFSRVVYRHRVRETLLPTGAGTEDPWLRVGAFLSSLTSVSSLHWERRIGRDSGSREGDKDERMRGKIRLPLNRPDELANDQLGKRLQDSFPFISSSA